MATLSWWHRLARVDPELRTRPKARSAIAIFLGVAFVWLNGLLARSVHQWTGVAFEADALWDSVALQAAFSIVWALAALAGMWNSTKRSHRSGWIGFAALLGVVVVKLFVVDLSQLSTGAKIGTFLVVGVLLLVVGYLSPVPPSRDPETGRPGVDEAAPAEGGSS